jgi:hypothetical protein
MIDYAPTQARSKGVISTPSCGWGQAEATVAKALSPSPPPTTNVMDKLVEIHAITATKLAECAHWCHSDSAPSPVRVDTG